MRIRILLANLPRIRVHLRTLCALIATILLATSCERTTPGNAASVRELASNNQERKAVRERSSKQDSLTKRFSLINYHRVPLDSSRVLDSIRRICANTDSTQTMYRILTLLNRKELRYVRKGDTIVMPNENNDNMLAYSLFPQYWEGADTIPKIIVVSNKWQSYACYEYGVLVRFAATNSGEERKPSFPGRYTVNWKQRLRISSLNRNWILPFTVNIHAQAGNAFHQFDMPGRPVSHSCFRQFKQDAEWLFEWVNTPKINPETHRPIPFSGTPVIVLDMFDFSRKRGGPWLELKSNKDHTIELPTDPLAMDEALIPISQIPHASRGSLRNKELYLTADSVLRERGIIRPGVILRESINYNRRRAGREGANKPAETPKVN